VHPRISVIVPCFDAGRLVLDAVASLDEPEPLELVVVDDASGDPATRTALDELAAAGIRVLRQEANQGAAGARTAGLRATSAPYVFPLDADDLANPGRIARAADRLDADPTAVACVGDYEEFGPSTIVRPVPDGLDPYRVAFTNEYPITALFRRSAVERRAGWRDPLPEHRGYEDWNLWMDLAQDRERVVHLGEVMYRRRLGTDGVNASARRHHAELYGALRDGHPRLFAELGEHRRRSPLPALRKRLYPIVYGDRRLSGGLRFAKPLLDRAGIWTARR
jgi:glycosyltransferase involved in cell wall biosynthesis